MTQPSADTVQVGGFAVPAADPAAGCIRLTVFDAVLRPIPMEMSRETALNLVESLGASLGLRPWPPGPVLIAEDTCAEVR
jgi:hypothetical protein